ncbi:HpcH/HpaI aldolase/citrate lyase family protein [Haloplanus pelagicus]|jgi:citrate lyase subunit beta/citryl-CoA lyase|uniref:HpcH/HpaI aldolase/citrate lyase family protein n=1 Tax=Haloplanus pelagicus TaxID=2949995 RepID=UPI00203A9BAA|nr:CoA ester lyase [Haloplanus sp. HW8-1]
MTNATLRRSQLVVPGNDVEVLDHAAASPADEVILDLEDSVRSSEKTEARERIVDALIENDWDDKLVSCRINGLNTRWWYDDVVTLGTNAGEHIDSFVLPKTDSADMVTGLDFLLTQVEVNAGLPSGSIGVEAQIESALGMSNVIEVAHAEERLDSLIFGPGDYSASIGVGGLTTGHSNLYPGHYWHYALSRLVHAAKGAGLQAIDGLYADFEDEEGFQEACNRAKMLGCDGKWVIHPKQVEHANTVFAPTEEQARLATQITEAYEEARREGQQTATFEGEIIDDATFRMAKNIMERAERAGVL